jgi:hypothetical protein
MHESKIITLYMLQRAGRLLVRKQCGQSAGVYKGRKLSIDAAELRGYAVKRNSGQPQLLAHLGIDERAFITCSAANRRCRQRECRCRSKHDF